jgi:protoheme IX farnesyltransferase
MLPVTSGSFVTKAKMLVYTAALLPATMSLFIAGSAGPYYFTLSTMAGVAYLLLTVEFARRPLNRKNALNLFFFSIAYLLLVFTVIFIDSHY